MLFNSIKIGDRIEISMIKSQTPYVFVSQVDEIIGDGELLIHMPISYGNLVRLPLKTKYNMVFFSDKGRLVFLAEVTGYRKEGTINLLSIKMVNEGQRIQMRAFYRYTCLLPLKFAVIDEPESEKEEEEFSVELALELAEEQQEPEKETLYYGIIKDIGGGGIRFVTNEDMEEGTVIKCDITLRKDHLIVTGKVLFKQYFPKSNYKYQYRVQFVGILPVEQEKIIQFIFVEQRTEMLRSRRDHR